MSQKITTMDGYRANIPKLPYTLSDHPSLVGIIRMPFCNVVEENINIKLPIYKDNKWQMLTQSVAMATNISKITTEDSNFTISKNSVTDFYPYTYYVLTDGECEPLIMKPQHMPNTCAICGSYALSNQPIERYYIKGYKGDNTGRIYNITNLNQMLLPTATNEGANFLNANANTIMQNRKNTITNNILSMTTNAISAFSGNPLSIVNTIGGGVSALNQVKSIDARNKDTLLTPNSISSFGTPSTRESFGNNEVRVLKYSVNDNIKSKINNFIQRYGNKYNNYANINLKTYKGYIKMVAPKLEGDIDNNHLSKIREILERGVYCE